MAKTLKPQTPMSPPAEEYAATCHRLSEQIRATAPCVLDVPYGPDPEQQIDIYLPDNAGDGSVPVFIFFHGGSMTHGYKEWLGFMAPAFTCMPAIFVSPGYRLAPETKFPDSVDDARSALKLVHESIDAHGGDRDRIFIGGHSSGGFLAAMLTLDTPALEAAGLAGDVIKGCFPVSGVFDLTDIVESGELPEFLREASDAPAASPIRYVDGNRVPFLLAIGDDDFPNLIPQTHAIAQALGRQSGVVEVMEMIGCDHFEINLRGGDVDGEWPVAVRRWMADPPGAVRRSA